jgi:hypothetical protein
MQATRIDVRRIAKLLAITAGLPLIVGVLIDLFFGTSPMATIVLGFLAIPLASVLVLRTTLNEFDRVIAQVAPKPADEQTLDDGDSSWAGTGLFEDDPLDSGLYLVANAASGKTEAVGAKQDEARIE